MNKKSEYGETAEHEGYVHVRRHVFNFLIITLLPMRLTFSAPSHRAQFAHVVQRLQQNAQHQKCAKNGPSQKVHRTHAARKKSVFVRVRCGGC